MAVKTLLQTRRGSSTDWVSVNPVLAAGEIGYDTTLDRTKIGDGSTPWVGLKYQNALGANLITDGGFEYGNGCVETVYVGTTTLIKDSTKALSGNNSLEVIGNSATTTTSLLLRGFGVEEGRSYYMSAYVKAGTTPFTSIRWSGTQAKPDGTLIFTATLPSTNINTNGYTQVSQLYTIPKGFGYHFFNPRLVTNTPTTAGSSFFVDDISIHDVTAVIEVLKNDALLATTAVNGTMSAEDKAKLDAASSTTVNDVLVKRSGAGNIYGNVFLTDVAQSSSANSLTRKDYVDSLIYRADAMPNAKDLNTITTTVNYNVQSSTQFTGGANYPIRTGGSGPSSGMFSSIARSDGTTVTHRYHFYDNDEIVVRRLYGGTWSAWRSVSNGSVVSKSALNVKDFNVVGDGVTDDTTNLNAAIAAAQGRELVFPKGQYKVTANLVNFWGCFTRGEGSILRGSEEFFISPIHSRTQITTNTLWANGGASGSDSNDGLFSVTPFKTQDKVYKSLRQLTPEQSNGGYWKVRMSGTFVGGQKYTVLPEFAFGLTFEGDPLVSGEPVTIVDFNTSDPSNFVGMWFEPGVRQVAVKNIKFTDFVSSGNGYGLLMKDGGNLEVDDCRAVNCDIGFAAVNNVLFSIETTNTTGCPTGFTASYSSSGTFNSCNPTDATDKGFSVTRNAVVHIDYCIITNCGKGVNVDMAARANLLGSDFRRNAIGVRAAGAAEWIGSGVIWNNSTPTVPNTNANTVNFVSFGVGREARQYSETSHNEFLVGSTFEAYPTTYGDPKVITGTTANSIVYVGSGLGEIPANWFVSPGKAIRVKVYGKATTSATGKVRLYVTELDGTSATLVTEIDVISGASNTAFEVEFKVWSKTVASQLARANIIGSGLSRAASDSKTINMLTDKLFRLYCLPGASADTFTFENMEVHLSG